MSRFEGKTILVTGAGSGIGAACVRRLFNEGASIVAADMQAENLEKVVAEFGGSDRVQTAVVDVTDRDQVSAMMSTTISRFGTPYGLVNSAGVRGVGSILDLEPEAWRRVISINLDGTFNMCQAFARALKEAQAPGAIVNVSSTAGRRGIPNRLSYTASKFGVSGLTQSMSLELAPLGIRVNAVAPGTIHTPMTDGMFRDPENAKRIRASHPIGREGQAEEVAGAIIFLLSDDASFVVGVVLPVDGGSTVGIRSH